MYINKIILDNFKIYNGHNEIVLSEGKLSSDKNVVIVSGQNGYGKTTFLVSLVWCLYGKNMGEVDEMYRKEIAAKSNYRKYISSCMNRKAAREGESEFSVEIQFSDVEVQGISCDVSVKRSYNTNLNDDGKLMVSLSGQPQELIDDLSVGNQRGEEIFIRDFILPIAIAKFFFFDAEKITALAETTETEQRRALSRAYSEVLGIHKYVSLRDSLEALLDEYRKKSATTEDKKELNQLRTDIENATLEIDSLDKERENLKDILDEKKGEADDIDAKLLRAGYRMTEEESVSLETRRKELEGRKSSFQEELRDSYNIIPFALAGETLAATLEQVKKERALKNAQFAQDDVEEKIKKIRQDIENEKRNVDIVFDVPSCDFFNLQIEKLIKKYFGSSIRIDTNIRNIHDFSESQENSLGKLFSVLGSGFKKNFERISSGYLSAKKELESINRKIRDAEKNAQDARVLGLRATRTRLESEIGDLNLSIGRLLQKSDDKRNEKKALLQKQTTLRERIDLASQYSGKEEKVLETIKILDVFISEFKKHKKESLQRKILETLNLLFHKKNFIRRVEVDVLQGEDIDIMLFGNDDCEIDKAAFSMGERQLYASALLSSLVSESEIDFPVFIDSPMQKFDKRHAENIIRHFYPTVAKQVVISPLLEKELTEKEYSLLKECVSKTFLIKNTSSDSSVFQAVSPEALFSSFQKGIDDAN